MKPTNAVLFLCLSLLAHSANADTFGSGANTFEIEFVTIGNRNNPEDTTGEPNPAGSVAYTYRIGKFEVSEDMIDKANAKGGLGITKDTRGPEKPATMVSWFDAARFVNWLNTSHARMPAYKFDGSGNFQLWAPGDLGYDPANLYRNSLARYYLPSVDEWYKAAYYDPTAGVYYDYPTGSDTPPTPVASGTAVGTAIYDQFGQGPADIMLAGGLSPYGTMGQAGNAWEWEETERDLVNDSISSYRGVRGGEWRLPDASPSHVGERYYDDPSGGEAGNLGQIGFRVARVIPEPSTALLACASLLCLAGRMRHRE